MIGDTTSSSADYFDYPASHKRRINTGAAIIPEKVGISSSALTPYEDVWNMNNMDNITI
jgi:hypothetical protein